jgi:hypothetical protein
VDSSPVTDDTTGGKNATRTVTMTRGNSGIRSVAVRFFYASREMRG